MPAPTSSEHLVLTVLVTLALIATDARGAGSVLPARAGGPASKRPKEHDAQLRL